MLRPLQVSAEIAKNVGARGRARKPEGRFNHKDTKEKPPVIIGS